MNTKRKFRTGTDYHAPTYLYQVDVDVEVRGKIKTYRLERNTVFSTRKRPGLASGKYVFQYAENTGGTLIIYADRYGQRRSIREEDITSVDRRE